MYYFRLMNYHRKRGFSYHFGIGLAVECSRIKKTRRNVRSTDWYDITVLNDFNDED